MKYQNSILIMSGLLVLFFNCSIFAQSDSTNVMLEESLREELLVEIDELIVDNTQTKIGRDFFDMYYQLWETPEVGTSYTIVVSEKPMPRLGALVSVTINDILIFQQFVQPRYDIMEEKVHQALYTSMEYLINYEEIQRSLQGEDLSGTGIY